MPERPRKSGSTLPGRPFGGDRQRYVDASIPDPTGRGGRFRQLQGIVDLVRGNEYPDQGGSARRPAPMIADYHSGNPNQRDGIEPIVVDRVVLVFGRHVEDL